MIGRMLPLLLGVCVAGCATGRVAGPDVPLELSLSLDAETYQPGQPVICSVAIAPVGDDPEQVLTPDHSTMTFMLQPAEIGGNERMKVIEPVHSPKEPAARLHTLPPGETLPRRFLFTRLTLERGDFQLMAIYETLDPESAGPLKIYAEPVPFAVAGEAAYAHRYPSGLLTIDDAKQLAREAVGRPEARAEAILRRDEKGFLKWWVNVYGAGADAAVERAFFVDPYRAVIWREAQPFSEEDASTQPDVDLESKRIRELRRKAREQRGWPANPQP